jgi:hypothetical protein
LSPGVRRYADEPQDQQKQQDQQHSEEVPYWMATLCRPGLRCWRQRSAAWSAGWASGRRTWSRRCCSISARARWWIRRTTLRRNCRRRRTWHYPSALRLYLLALTPVKPVQILVAARRHIAKVPGACATRTVSRLGHCRRAFGIETTETTDTDRVFSALLPREALSCPSLKREAHASNAAAV